MPTYTGKIKSVTVSSSSCVFTVSWANPSPPPPEFTQTFPDVPTWVREAVLPNVGKNVTVITSGDPETITTVTVTA